MLLAACGFTPAYGPGGSAGKLTETVWVQDPTDKYAFDLVERLEERLGRPENIRFDLAYTITTETVGVGITTDNKITRYNLKGVVDYTLTDTGLGRAGHGRAGAKLYRLFRHGVHRCGSGGRGRCGPAVDAHPGRPDRRPADCWLGQPAMILKGVEAARYCAKPDPARRGSADLWRRCDAGGA